MDQRARAGADRQVLSSLVRRGTETTFKHLFGPKQTVQSPKQRHEIPDPLIYRGVHRLNRDEQGRVKCVACFLCATACPAHCIDIVGAESPWPDREKYPQSFTIDELRCIYCGMCEEACPVDAIELTSLYDLSGKSREEMIFDKEKLLSVYDQTKDAEPMKSARPADARWHAGTAGAAEAGDARRASKSTDASGGTDGASAKTHGEPPETRR